MLYLNLCSRKWLGPSYDLTSYLMPLGLWQLNRLLGDVLINCSKEMELCISVSNLFHSRITETTKSKTTFNNRLYFQIVTYLLKSWEGKIARIVFQVWNDWGGAYLRLNTSFQENDMFISMIQSCISLRSGNTITNLQCQK